MRRLKQPSHEAAIRRLKRAHGHLGATLNLARKKRPCLELARQLQAAEAAIGAAKREFIHGQLQVSIAGGDADNATLRQLRQLARYL